MEENTHVKKFCWTALCFLAIGFMFVGHMDLDAKGHEKFKVAMLLPGSISDAGWNALAYEGLVAIEKEPRCRNQSCRDTQPIGSRRTIPFLRA